MAMQLIGDGGGNLYLNEVLFASMKKVFWKKILEEASLNLELQQYLIGCEQ